MPNLTHAQATELLTANPEHRVEWRHLDATGYHWVTERVRLEDGVLVYPHPTEWTGSIAAPIDVLFRNVSPDTLAAEREWREEGLAFDAAETAKFQSWLDATAGGAR